MVFGMNKKLMSLVLVGMLGFGMFGCTSEEEVTVEQIETKVTEEGKTEEIQETDVVMVDNEYCKITLKGKYQDEVNGEVGYKVLIENKCDKDLSMYATELSVNGMMNENFAFYEDISVGKKCNSEIVWYTWIDGQEITSMEDLVDVQMTIVVYSDEVMNNLVEETIVID